MLIHTSFNKEVPQGLSHPIVIVNFKLLTFSCLKKKWVTLDADCAAQERTQPFVGSDGVWWLDGWMARKGSEEGVGGSREKERMEE